MGCTRTSGKTRKSRGYSLAEMPAGLMLLFIGIAFPMIILASIAYRSFLVFFATRDCCMKAAKQPTFTQAQATGTAVFNTDMAAWNGISGTEQTNIVTKPLGGGANSISGAPLASVDTNNNIYFIQVVCTGSVAPLIVFNGGWMGINVPGLTGPYPLTIAVEFYAENTQGLTH